MPASHCTTCGTLGAPDALVCEACGAPREGLATTLHLNETMVRTPRVPMVTSTQPVFPAAPSTSQSMPPQSATPPTPPGYEIPAGPLVDPSMIAPRYAAATSVAAAPAKKSNGLWLALGGAGVAIVILVVVIIVLATGKSNDNNVHVAAASNTSVARMADTNVRTSSSTDEATQQATQETLIPSTQPATTAVPVTPAADPEATAGAQLQQIANQESSTAEAFVGNWVPQLDAKYAGLSADGITWSNQNILQNYLNYQQKYPGAVLIRSTQFASIHMSQPFWVVFAPETYSSPSDALGWCTDQGIDRNHCYAQLISHDGSISPTQQLNN